MDAEGYSNQENAWARSNSQSQMMPRVSSNRTKSLWAEKTKPMSGEISGEEANSPVKRSSDDSKYWVAPASNNVAERPKKGLQLPEQTSGYVDERQKYFVPGYMGFVRGQQFRLGDTYVAV